MSAEDQPCYNKCKHLPLGGHTYAGIIDYGRYVLCRCGVSTNSHVEHVRSAAEQAMLESIGKYSKVRNRAKAASDRHIADAVRAAQVLLSVMP
jgi:hypothetical protein